MRWSTWWVARLVREEQLQRLVSAVVAIGRDANDPIRIPAVSRDPDDDYLLASSASTTQSGS
jgi:hypothetical protein